MFTKIKQYKCSPKSILFFVANIHSNQSKFIHKRQLYDARMVIREQLMASRVFVSSLTAIILQRRRIICVEEYHQDCGWLGWIHI